MPACASVKGCVIQIAVAAEKQDLNVALSVTQTANHARMPHRTLHMHGWSWIVKIWYFSGWVWEDVSGQFPLGQFQIGVVYACHGLFELRIFSSFFLF